MWQAFAKAANSPQLVEQYDRLLAVPAPRSGPPAVVHGDTKLSNLMWQDRQVSAVLDWEMALDGEPLADLGYMLYGFESPYHGPTTPQKQPGMPGREQVIAWWKRSRAARPRACSGTRSPRSPRSPRSSQRAPTCGSPAAARTPSSPISRKNLDYYLGVMRPCSTAADSEEDVHDPDHCAADRCGRVPEPPDRQHPRHRRLGRPRLDREGVVRPRPQGRIAPGELRPWQVRQPQRARRLCRRAASAAPSSARSARAGCCARGSRT